MSYDTFITLGDLLDHTCIYCPIFPTAVKDAQALFQARCGSTFVKTC